MKGPVIDIRKAIRSFRYALAGLFRFFQEENNARIHLLVAFSVCLVAFGLSFTLIEWCILLLTITIVFVAEIFNTALERLADKVSYEYDPLIKSAKDIAAAAVLIAALGACLVGALLFVPKLSAIL